MGLRDWFRRREERPHVRALVGYVLDGLTTERGIRAEDAVTVAATIVAERCIDVAGEFPLRHHDFTPGSHVFSMRINELLSGDVVDGGWNAVPADSVFGALRAGLDRSAYRPDCYPELTSVFRCLPAGIGGDTEWGHVPLSIHPDNRPSVLPLRAGFETRKFVDGVLRRVGDDRVVCLSIATRTLAEILNMVAGTLDPRTGLTLALEMVNGMAKTAPMTEAHFESALRSSPDEA